MLPQGLRKQHLDYRLTAKGPSLLPVRTCWSRPKGVVVLADTPNLFRCLQQAYGHRTHPDYARIYRAAQQYGEIRKAIAFVNDGVHAGFAQSLGVLGFSVVYPHAPDVDDSLTAHAVALHSCAQRLILCSGDGDFLPLVDLLRARGIGVVVCAVRRYCHRRLIGVADSFLEVPRLETAAY